MQRLEICDVQNRRKYIIKKLKSTVKNLFRPANASQTNKFKQ